MFSVSNRLAPSALDTNHNKNVEVFFFFHFPKGDYFRYFQNEGEQAGVGGLTEALKSWNLVCS